jgi:hypothetical protein
MSRVGGGSGSSSGGTNGFEHIRDPNCTYWEEMSKRCTLGTGDGKLHCHVLKSLYRRCHGKHQAELVEKVEADSTEESGSMSTQRGESGITGFPADPFELARKQMEEAFSFENNPAFRFFFDQGVSQQPPPHRHRYGRSEQPQQPGPSSGARDQSNSARWKQYDSEDV